MLVLGLGESGLAMARWCARWGARVSVADSRDNPPHAHTLRRELPQVQLRQGVAAEVLGDARLVLKSPGLSPRDEALQPLLAAARERGVDVQGELYLFARALEDLRAEREYAPAVLDTEARRYPAVAALTGALGGTAEVRRVPIPADCVDGFNEAYYARPEMLLDPAARQACSAWSFVPPGVAEDCAGRLARALADGTWDTRHGHLRTAPAYDGSLVLVRAV